MIILETKKLTKKYGKKENTIYALDGIDLKVNKGEFIAVVGASGSGKSTLMHILGGVDSATSGEVFINGIDINDLNDDNLAVFRRREVGLIYQFYNLIPILNVEENITLPVLLDSAPIDKEYLNELINLLGLEKRINHLPKELSGGEQQRVSIARSIMNKPTIILADEPTGNLDSKNGKEIIELFKRLNKKYNQTIIMITHDQNIALEANRIITISDGKIIKDEVVK